MKYLTRIKLDDSKHLYDVEVDYVNGNDVVVAVVPIEANNRAQASKIAEDHGFRTRSVNMVG